MHEEKKDEGGHKTAGGSQPLTDGQGSEHERGYDQYRRRISEQREGDPGDQPPSEG